MKVSSSICDICGKVYREKDEYTGNITMIEEGNRDYKPKYWINIKDMKEVDEFEPGRIPRSFDMCISCRKTIENTIDILKRR